MEIYDASAEELKKRLKKYSESLEKHQPIIFCVNCGSTNLDQNSVSEIQCYDCRNEGIWNGRKFSIARKGNPRDVLSAIRPPSDPFYFTSWRSLMLESVEDFFQSISSSITRNGDSISQDDCQKLLDEWKTLQDRVELILREVKILPDEE